MLLRIASRIFFQIGILAELFNLVFFSKEHYENPEGATAVRASAMSQLFGTSTISVNPLSIP